MNRTEENTRVVENLFNNLNKGDLAAVMDAFTDLASWTYPAGTPIAGLHQGKEGIRKQLGMRREGYPGGMRFIDLTIHSAGDRVFAEYKWTATTGRGEKIEERALAVFELSFDKVTAVREFTMGEEALVLSRRAN